jgi:hypothetical protein
MTNEKLQMKDLAVPRVRGVLQFVIWDLSSVIQPSLWRGCEFCGEFLANPGLACPP